MKKSKNSARVAIIQAAPIIMDREATTEKAVSLTLDTGKKNAKLVPFPETYILAYPRGLGFGTKVGSRAACGRKDWLRYWNNSVSVPSDTTGTWRSGTESRRIISDGYHRKRRRTQRYFVLHNAMLRIGRDFINRA